MTSTEKLADITAQLLEIKSVLALRSDEKASTRFQRLWRAVRENQDEYWPKLCVSISTELELIHADLSAKQAAIWPSAKSEVEL